MGSSTEYKSYFSIILATQSICSSELRLISLYSYLLLMKNSLAAISSPVFIFTSFSSLISFAASTTSSNASTLLKEATQAPSSPFPSACFGNLFFNFSFTRLCTATLASMASITLSQKHVTRNSCMSVPPTA